MSTLSGSFSCSASSRARSVVMMVTRRFNGRDIENFLEMYSHNPRKVFVYAEVNEAWITSNGSLNCRADHASLYTRLEMSSIQMLYVESVNST